MILRLGLPVLLLLTSPIGRGCSPAEPGGASGNAAGDIRAAAEAAAPEEPPPEPTPAPPPRIEFSPDAFATPSGELAAAGTSLRLAAASLESGAFDEVLTLVPAPGKLKTLDTVPWKMLSARFPASVVMSIPLFSMVMPLRVGCG